MTTQILQRVPNTNPLPPRYSSLEGALSPEAANILRSFCTEAVHTLSNANSIGHGEDRTRGAYPPRYSGVFQRSASTARYHHRHRPGANNHSFDSQLAAGSHPFEYHIRTGHGSRANRDRPWATLKLFSLSSSSTSSPSSRIMGPGKIPKFTSKDLVQGCLELNLDSPQNINSISLSLIGKIVTDSYEGGSCTFLNQSIISWTRAHGDPRTVILNPEPTAQSAASSSSSSIETTIRSKKFDGKLSGQYIWPYSFAFPSEITLQEGDGRKYPAPQTFLERGQSTTVQYSLVLKMTHGMLRADTKLQVGIVYVPEITPPPASLLRQVAYSQGVGIPGPAADPLGWHESSPAHMFGKLPNGKAAKMQSSLFLANPLAYTRGTVIPIHLVVRSSNPETSEGLPEPKEIVVRLTRCVQHYQSAADSLSLSRGAPVQRGTTTTRSRHTTSGRQDEDMEEEKIVIGQVVWQEPSSVEDIVEGSHVRRRFDGEIHLPKDMQPSCGFRLFRISYAVELLSFSNSILKSQSLPEILLSQPVTIATQHGTGPIPIPATRPSSRGSSSRSRQ